MFGRENNPNTPAYTREMAPHLEWSIKMGCDIHPVVEVRMWNEWRLVALNAAVPHERNYATFAILANVRNGVGFAGVPTHEVLDSIAEPRGMPGDISIELLRLKHADEYILGNHSYSYVTLREMRAYNLDRQLLMFGVMNAENAALVDAGGVPKQYASAVWRDGYPDPAYVSREWHSPLGKEAWVFVELLKFMESILARRMYEDQYTDADVRLVFGFDS